MIEKQYENQTQFPLYSEIPYGSWFRYVGHETIYTKGYCTREYGTVGVEMNHETGEVSESLTYALVVEILGY